MRYPVQEHYSTRCLISHRPPFRTGEPLFFRCGSCGSVYVVNSSGNRLDTAPEVRCCGNDLRALVSSQDPKAIEEHRLDFVVFGGFDGNAVRITVDGGLHPMEDGHRIEWVYLRTFQGGQLKYLPEKGRSIASFAFADEDAYVYCDREVCRMGREHCQFECKRGLVLYAYCSAHGLFRLELKGKE